MEEVIKIVEDFIKYCSAEQIQKSDKGNFKITVDEDDIEALENLLTRYKQLEEENRGLKIFKEMTIYRLDVIEPRELISKSKIKEKIEEFKERNCLTCGKCENSDNYEETYNNYISCDIGLTINTLQDLLEEDK